MNASASNSLVPSSATADVSPPVSAQPLSLLKRPDFAAGIEEFRKHFGQDVRSKTTEGYTFLGLDKAVFGQPPSQQQQNIQSQPKPEPAQAKLAEKTPVVLESSPVISSKHQLPQSQSSTAASAPRPRAARLAAKGVAPAEVEIEVLGDNCSLPKEDESTLDHLLGYIKTSPPVSATATASMATADAPTMHRLTFRKTVVVCEAQARLSALAPALPAHLDVILPSVRRLEKLQLRLDEMQAQAILSKQQPKAQQHRASRGHTEHAKVVSARSGGALGEYSKGAMKKTDISAASNDCLNENTRSPPDSDSGQQPCLPRLSLDHGLDADMRSARKRPRLAFDFQIRVPKKARQRVLDAITAASLGKRATSGNSAGDEALLEAKRARKTAVAPPATTEKEQGPARSATALKSSRRSRTAQLSPTRSSSATRSDSHNRPRALDRNRSRDASGSRLSRHRPEQRIDDAAREVLASDGRSHPAAEISSSEIEQLKRLSARLENYMRSFKHSGDAEREPKGRLELEVGYYLESLACCLEDFWCRRAFQPLLEAKKKWSTMLDICEYLHRRCSTRDLSPLCGCATLITACVYYQLSSTALEIGKGTREYGELSKITCEVARYQSEMEKNEQSSRQLLSAHEISRLFPMTWKRCQLSPSAHAKYEPRSQPLASKWPAVAYPLSATSNPMDVANFVRQLGHEWLDRSGLALKAPKAQSNA
ncbi:hypothetical protein GGI04_001896 [Coemansia thaxteri]|nr:hypothetical protein GGI04_001896 [Coemansia thaxteri]KAJ2471117.1 hypothetical protein GGI02_002482 [Coemansia sp. RSA 2322]